AHPPPDAIRHQASAHCLGGHLLHIGAGVDQAAETEQAQGPGHRQIGDRFRVEKGQQSGQALEQTD
ncbi:MAG: hypothetical protein ACK559_37765, partial [bacterium]